MWYYLRFDRDDYINRLYEKLKTVEITLDYNIFQSIDEEDAVETNVKPVFLINRKQMGRIMNLNRKDLIQ